MKSFSFLSPTLTFALTLLFVVSNHGTAATESSANCVEEFGQCVTNRDCCGQEQRGDVKTECVTGDWEFTTDSTCLSMRSQRLEALSKENGFDHKSLTVLLKHYIYELPRIREQHNERFRDKKIDPLFYENIAKKYRHEFAKLIANLERKYNITDETIMPTLIRDFLSWSETVDIAEVFSNGLPEEKSPDDIGSTKTEF